MNKPRLFTGLTLASAILIFIATGCKKSNDGGGNNTAGIGATVSGAAWQSQYAQSIEPSGNNYITLSSWDKTAHKIAGTFSGVFYNTSNSNDSIKIDNGYFNTSYIV